MAARRPSIPKSAPNTANASVDAFMAQLEHPHKAGVDELRKAILAIDSNIAEEVKWNAPSFKLTDHFATFKLHPPKHIQLVLHTGAKPLVPARQFTLDAPSNLLKWAAPDRCVLTLKTTEEATKYEADVVSIVRQWLAQL